MSRQSSRSPHNSRSSPRAGGSLLALNTAAASREINPRRIAPAGYHASTTRRSSSLQASPCSLQLGDRCMWKGVECVVRYLGPLEGISSDSATLFCGVELMEPNQHLGDNSGMINGTQYFVAPPKSAVFCPVTDVHRLPHAARDSSLLRDSSRSPQPYCREAFRDCAGPLCDEGRPSTIRQLPLSGTEISTGDDTNTKESSPLPRINTPLEALTPNTRSESRGASVGGKDINWKIRYDLLQKELDEARLLLSCAQEQAQRDVRSAQEMSIQTQRVAQSSIRDRDAVIEDLRVQLQLEKDTSSELRGNITDLNKALEREKSIAARAKEEFEKRAAVAASQIANVTREAQVERETRLRAQSNETAAHKQVVTLREQLSAGRQLYADLQKRCQLSATKCDELEEKLSAEKASCETLTKLLATEKDDRKRLELQIHVERGNSDELKRQMNLLHEKFVATREALFVEGQKRESTAQQLQMTQNKFRLLDGGREEQLDAITQRLLEEMERHGALIAEHEGTLERLKLTQGELMEARRQLGRFCDALLVEQNGASERNRAERLERDCISQQLSRCQDDKAELLRERNEARDLAEISNRRALESQDALLAWQRQADIEALEQQRILEERERLLAVTKEALQAREAEMESLAESAREKDQTLEFAFRQVEQLQGENDVLISVHASLKDEIHQLLEKLTAKTDGS